MMCLFGTKRRKDGASSQTDFVVIENADLAAGDGSHGFATPNVDLGFTDFFDATWISSLLLIQ